MKSGLRTIALRTPGPSYLDSHKRRTPGPICLLYSLQGCCSFYSTVKEIFFFPRVRSKTSDPTPEEILLFIWSGHFALTLKGLDTNSRPVLRKCGTYVMTNFMSFLPPISYSCCTPSQKFHLFFINHKTSCFVFLFNKS